LIELGKLKLTQDTLLIISAVISVVILVFLFLIKISFHREEILSKWRTYDL